MPATAENLRELHQLHQRAKALRDRLASAPKTLASRQTALDSRKAALEDARKGLQDAKVQLKKREHTMQGQQAKIDDLKVKLNLVKKNEEYKAIQNQIANEKASLGNLEDDILNGYSEIEAQSADVAKLEAEYKQFADEVAAFRAQVESQAGPQKAQLAEIERAIADAETIIPEEQRERYRRTLKQHGADAMAAVDVDFKTHTGTCSGCYVTITTQTLSEVINAETLSFCKTCGRILYLAEEDHQNTKRTAR